jgi:hypothetical protein
VPRSREYNLGTELILLSVRALDEILDGAGHAKSTRYIGVLWALWKVQNKAILTVPPEGQTGKWKALNPGVKAANVP